MGKSRVRNCLRTPPPSRQGKTFCPPPLIGLKPFAPPPITMAKTSSSRIKTTPKLSMTPFSMAKTFSGPPFCRGQTTLAPPPSRFVVLPPPLPVISDHSLSCTYSKLKRVYPWHLFLFPYRDVVPGVPVGTVLIHIGAFCGIGHSILSTSEAQDRPVCPSGHLCYGLFITADWRGCHK